MASLTSLPIAFAIAAMPALAGRAHEGSNGWAYPPACCKGNEQGGDCHRIPEGAVATGRYGFSVHIKPGHHPMATREHRFLIPYGNEIPSGDGYFHICLYPNEDHVNCFFAPPDGV